MNKPSQVVILCGGLGTRLRPYTEYLPKPMIQCNGKPFLLYLLQQMSNQGLRNFVLLTGYLSKNIEIFFGDGSQWGWSISYSKGSIDWDTGRRLWEAKDLIEDSFILLYSDNFVPFSLSKLYSAHLKNSLPLTLMVSKKTKGNIQLDDNGLVLIYDNSRSSGTLNYVEIGYMIVEKHKTLSFYDSPDCSFSLILEKMSNDKQIGTSIQHNSYYSISDSRRWQLAEEYLKPKKIILIDRDGVINHKANRGEYINKWEGFKFIEDTVEAMKYLSQKGFEFIVLTNQAGIARGITKDEDINFIHEKMKNYLYQLDINILDVYVCPHHWDDNCFCRKPNPGMFFEASKDYKFRLDQTLFIGDDPRDCQAAEKAGSKSIFIGNTSELSHLSIEELPFHASLTLKESIHSIISFYENSLGLKSL